MYFKNQILKKVTVVLFVMVFSSLSVNAQQYQANGKLLKYSQVRVNISGINDISLFARAGLAIDNIDYYGTYFDVIWSNEEIAILKGMKIPYQVLVDDMETAYRERLHLSKAGLKALKAEQSLYYNTPSHFHFGSMGGYLTFQEVLADLDSMRILYPNLISVRDSIGASIEGRGLWAVKISDSPDIKENEREVLYTGLHHAREPEGMTALIYFMWYLLENYGTDPTVTNLVDNRELYFVPVVNPDGYVYNQQTNPSGGGMWRKNRHNNGDGSYGIDLNRNYGYQWGYDNTGSSPTTSSEIYRGTSPFSEPETQAIRDFAINHHFKMSVSYHSYSNLLIFPWAHRADYYTPDHSLFVRWGRDMTQYNHYEYGTCNQVIGYVSNGDSDDWMYGERVQKNGIFGFSPEIGSSKDGFWPDQSRIIPLADENVYLNLVIAQAGGDDIIPPTISNEHANSINVSSALITWSTDENSNSIVEFGVSTSYGDIAYDTTIVTNHSISITGLTPNTVYHYRVKSTDLSGNISVSGDYTFQTGGIFSYAPTATKILQGSLNSGSYTNLATNNSIYYTVNSTTIGTPTMDWYGKVTIAQAPTSALKLTITYDGQFSRNVKQTLYLYDWSTATWTEVNSRNVGASDITIIYSTTSPANYLSTSGQIRFRVLGEGNNQDFTGSGDFMQFTVETAGMEF